MKSNSLFVSIMAIISLVNVYHQNIIHQKPKLYIKKNYPAPERSLRQIKVSKQLGSQDYNLDDDLMEITKKQFMDKLNLKDHVNLHKPLENYLSHSRVLTDEVLPDINKDFFEKVKSGVNLAFDEGTYEFKDGDNMITISKGGEMICDVKLRTEPQKDKDHHNVFITMDNYAYTGDFDRKKMEGLSIIETDGKHRDEISAFMGQKLPEFEATEEENQTKAENGLKSVGDGLSEILGKIDEDIKLVGGDENSGYVYEKRTPEGMILILAMAYKVGPELYEVRVKTRALDEFEMQIREFLREEDKNILEAQISDLVKVPGADSGFTIEEITTKMNALVKTAPPELTEHCPEGITFSLEGLGTVPNTAVLNTDNLPMDMNDSFGFDDMGGEQEENKEEKVCLFHTSFVIILEGLDMPYVFFSFRNSRLVVDHFVPAIDKTTTESSLEDAWQGIIALSSSIDKAIKDNLQPDGSPKEKPEEFSVVKLKEEISNATKKFKMKMSEESPHTFWKQDGVIRIMITEVGKVYKVNFNFPHKLFKNKESSKPITNEFIFNNAIAYDAVLVFKDTLNKFVTALDEANKGKHRV